MPWHLISSEPLIFLVWILSIVYALTIHEFSHALAALALGDETPKNSGRLTLNPISHIDVMGFFMLIFIGFGWGKPVVFDHRNVRFGKWGAALIGLAGPIANFISAFIFASVLKIIGSSLD
ncbi:MAG: site-2 protease family protein [Parcubacteria group bacterium]|nr:site-2 protease family protein [Parcubacteria group bacterium]